MFHLFIMFNFITAEFVCSDTKDFFYKEIQTGSWFGIFYLAQESPTRLNGTFNKNIQNAAATMASTYCPVKLTPDYLPKIKINFSMKRKNISLHIREGKGIQSQIWDPNHKLQTKRNLSHLQPLTPPWDVLSVHLSWSLHRTSDSLKRIFPSTSL